MANLLLAVLLLAQIPLPGAQTGTIEGRILSMDGSPAAGLRVAAQVVSDDPADLPNVMAAIVQTDSAGRFRLETLPAGRYYIAAGLVDFPTYYPGVTAIGEARTVAVTAGASLTGIDFTIARPQGLKVSGRVIREGNAPAPAPTPFGQRGLIAFAATQRVLLSSPGRPAYNVIPGSDGTFEFANVIPGNYTIGLSPQNGFQAQRIVVSDKDIQIELRAPIVFNVSGRLVVENNGARPRLGLVFNDAAGLRTNALISSSGTYSAVLPPGTYRVTTQPLQPGFSLKSMASGNVDLLRESLTVAGEGTPEIVVTLGVSSPPPWVKVSGRVVGTTLAGNERISLTGPAAGEILETMVLPDGGFEFQKVLPGQYNGRIQSLAPAVIADPLTLVVGTTDINNWEVRLPATVDVPGRVVFSGPPIPNTRGARSMVIRFTLTAANGSLRRSVGAALQQADGSFSLTLPEGSNRLSLDTLPAGYVVKSMTYGTTDLLAGDVTIDSKAVRDLTIVLEPAAGTWVKVSGRVTGLEPSVARAQVTLLGNAQAGTFEAIANPDGSFEFPRVWPGSYSARVFVASPLGVNTTTTLVVPSTDLTGIELKMPKYRDAVGRISLEGAGMAIQPRFWFTLTAANTPANTVTVYPVSPGDAGFRIPLPEGEWRVALGGLPADLNVRSLTYGDVDLLKSAVRFTDADAQQLQLTFGVSAAGLVRLSGRVIGPLRQSDTIRLTGVASAETRLQPDGTFEFPRVLPGSYSWGFAYGWTRIAVPNKDLTDLTIRSIRGRVVFEEPTAAQPTPLYVQASDGGGTSAASVQRDGSFVLITAEGTYRLTMSTIPIGMYVKSIRYGDSDVVNQLLIVAPGQETSNLEIVIGRRP